MLENVNEYKGRFRVENVAPENLKIFLVLATP